MPKANKRRSISIETGENSVKQACLAIVKESPSRVRADVSKLNHRGETAIYEQRRLDDSIDLRKQRSLPMIFAHRARQAARLFTSSLSNRVIQLP